MDGSLNAYEEPSDDKAVGDDANDTDGLLAKFKQWYKYDRQHSAEWRKEAKEDFDFVAGHQWSEDDKRYLASQMRPVITFNRVAPTIESVVGMEIGNRREVQFIPRTLGDSEGDEVLSAAAEWVRDESDAENEESDAFFNTVVCGMGWIDTRMDYEDDPDGEICMDNLDPLEMLWDNSSRKRNLSDARRMWRIRDMPIEDARLLVPGFEDEELDAAWARDEDRKDPHNADPELAYTQGDQSDSKKEKTVTLVHIQWFEREAYHRVAFNGQTADVSPDEFKDLQKKFTSAAETQGIAAPKLPSVNLTRKVYKQAFIGSRVLTIEDGPCKGHFSWQCITGKRDRNKGTFYGLVRAMKDPQKWANKWLSQSLHILNTNAKGGLVAERTAFEDIRQAEDSWAKSDTITWAKEGAVSQGKFAPKPTSQFPTGFENLMQFAISSIRDVTGVNQEVLGLADRDQPGILEDQRKQAGMTILAMLFDNLRSYRKRQGRVMLYFIQTYISDGRLIRIVGDENAQYVPLIKQEGFVEYDVIVDDAPSSPNQKEKTWNIIMGLMPTIGPMMDAETMLALAKYSPLPTSVVRELTDAYQKKQQGQQQDQEQAKQMSVEEHQAKTAKMMSEAQKNQAQAQKAAMPEAPAPGQAPDPGAYGKAYSEIAKNQAQVEVARTQAAKNQAQAETQQIKTLQAIHDLQNPKPIVMPNRPSQGRSPRQA